ncbi:hypothetical protein GCM10009838_43500 [Catenulispora subtropica]|uniref:Uncharacterized protein n=1 Tax=Catenulispora subtropica TaxID=450798 RepID=A0ABP5DDF3_9ACTN
MVSKPDAAWRSVAPTARRPAITTAKELEKPTSAVTIPAPKVGPSPARRPPASDVPLMELGGDSEDSMALTSTLPCSVYGTSYQLDFV